jgi:hypothetical protein
MNRIFLFTIGVMLLLAGRPAYPQMAGYYPKGGPDIEAEDVSLIQLIANPQAYDHKRVRIIGYLHLEFEGNAIYLHREDFDYGLTKNAIWINVPGNMTEEQMKLVNDSYVICTARFRAGRQGHMGMNSGEFYEVTRLETWPHHSRSVSGAPNPTQRQPDKPDSRRAP